MATGYAPPVQPRGAPPELPPPPVQNPDGTITLPNGRVTLPGAVINPDGSVTAPNGNPGGTITFNGSGVVTSQSGNGLTTTYGPDGQATGTFKADGTPATAGQVQNANNAHGDHIIGSLLAHGAVGDAADAVLGKTPGPYSPGSYLNPLDPGGVKLIRDASGNIVNAAGAAGKAAASGAKTIADAVGNTIGGGGVGSVDTGGITDAAAAAKALSDQYNAERNSYVNGAPVNLSPAQIAEYQAAIAPGPITAGQASGSGASGGHSVAAVAAPSVKAELAKYDTQYELAARENQQKLVEGLQGAIEGKDPSVAAIQLRQSTDRNIANQYALAASARGMDTGLAQRQAMLGASDLNAKAAADASILRAQEIQAARAQLADTLGTQRAGDLQVAGTTFNAEQGVNNDFAGAQNTRSNLNATLENQTGIANAGNDTSASIATANNATNASIASANNLTSANNTTAQIQSEIARANALNQSNQSINQAQLNQGQSQFNVNATLAQQKADQEARDALAKNALAGTGQNITGTNNAAQVQVELAKAKAIKDAAIIGGVSAGSAALIPKLF